MDVEFAEEMLRAMRGRIPFEIVAFGGALEEADALTDGWTYFLEKTWKWSGAYVAWNELGSPRAGDGIAWDQFLTKLDRIAAA